MKSSIYCVIFKYYNHMAIQESDIKFYYSQPPTGTEYSFGGTYSNEITGKNLFSNISQTTLANGIIDYRCIYLKNSNETESFNDFNIKSCINF